LEVFVPVRVEVRVRVEVPCPGAETVGVEGVEGEARGEVLPDALPVGVGTEVVTSTYSMDSTSVTVGALKSV
jgi:hypothetical protein